MLSSVGRPVRAAETITAWPVVGNNKRPHWFVPAFPTGSFVTQNITYVGTRSGHALAISLRVKQAFYP